jgi:dihydroorotate dehydrogenase
MKMEERDKVAWLLAAYRGLLRPWLYRMDPEVIHEWMIRVLGRMPVAVMWPLMDICAATEKQPVTVAGIEFPGRVGVAAGLDKDGKAASAWAAFGFGFAELGTVTPLPQPGNAKPRLYRWKASQAFVNRMGFNNHGALALAEWLTEVGVQRGNFADQLGIPMGISIGKNKWTPLENAVEDYLACFDAVAPVADYIAVNISSPNTPGLRDLQASSELRKITTALTSRAQECFESEKRGFETDWQAKPGNPPQPAFPVPVFVKFAPDLADEDLYSAIEVCEDTGVSGIIATNTTLSRENLKGFDELKSMEPGGLSGAPLTDRAVGVVEKVRARTTLPIIGCGGIMTPHDARRFFDAGADLLEVFTGFIYNGPALIRAVNAMRV